MGMYTKRHEQMLIYMPICISGAKLSAFFVGVKLGKFCYN
jgi:hypothetical protein